MKNTAKLWENLHKHSFNACLKWKYLSGAYNLPDRGELGLALVLKELIIQLRVKLSLNLIIATIYWVETPASHSSKCLTYACVRACSIAQPCPTLWPHGSSVHRISQTRIVEWVAIPFSRGSSWPKDWIHFSCTGRRIEFFTAEPPRKPICLII